MHVCRRSGKERMHEHRFGARRKEIKYIKPVLIELNVIRAVQYKQALSCVYYITGKLHTILRGKF